MEIIVWIIAGGQAGWLAAVLLRTDKELGSASKAAAGFVGASLGAVLFQLLNAQPSARLNLLFLMTAVVGAAFLLAGYRAARGRSA